MNVRCFIPCAVTLLLVLGFGGRALANQTDADMRLLVAAAHILVGLMIIALRGRLAGLWSSSTLLPAGCGAVLMLAGVVALS